MDQRNRDLDGLRGIAIAMVVAYHYVTPLLPEGRATSVFSALASSGVDLFFVLSGYLLGGILLEQRHSARFFRVFYARRGWRTLPLYTVLVTVGAGVALVGYDRWNPVLRETLPWWSYVTMTQNVTRATHAAYGSVFTAPTWSLALEEQFYLVLPWLIWATPTHRVPLFSAVALVCAPVLRAAAATSSVADPYTAAYAWPLGRADVLASGVFVAWLVRHWRCDEWGRWLSAAAASAALLAVAVMLADPPLSIYVVVVYSALAVCYGVALLRLVTATHASTLSRLCRLDWLRWTGTRAYGIYLLHIPVVHAVHWAAFGRPILGGHGLSSAVASAIALMLSLWLAHLSWSRFEYPLVRWSRARWAYAP
jgi:peptidoglycan/LPS O-acetylase OafA/YrhL